MLTPSLDLKQKLGKATNEALTGFTPLTHYMGIYAGSVKIKKRDGTLSVTVDNIVISGEEEFDMKRNYDNLKRALRYMKGGSSKGEDASRWVIVEIIIYKRLDTFPIVSCHKPYTP